MERSTHPNRLPIKCFWISSYSTQGSFQRQILPRDFAEYSLCDPSSRQNLRVLCSSASLCVKVFDLPRSPFSPATFTPCYDFLMPARPLDGIKIRDEIFAELRAEHISMHIHQHIRPGLAAVLVGDDPASQLYVKSKIEACHHLGLASWLHTPAPSVTTDDMLKLVAELNSDYRVDGILIHHPPHKQADTKRVLEAVDPAKDVDGFHPVNLGKLVSNRPGLVACTPAGCMEILRRNEIRIEGANAVVLGRSDIVGKPMALLLLHANATVTICHSKTRDLPEVVRRADIIVAAMGKAGYVAADWI